MSENICSVCGKPFEYALKTSYDAKTKKSTCVHDDPSIGASDPLEAQRKMNRESSMDAQRYAAQAMSDSEAIDPSITVRSENPDPRFGGNIKVKKSVIDNLTQKAEQSLDLTPPSGE